MNQASNLQRIVSFSAFVMAVVCWLPTAVQAGGAPPPNDDCVDAFALSSGSELQSTENATLEIGEPATSCVGLTSASVWFEYVAPYPGVLELDTENSDFDTVLTVYTGACGALSEVADGCNDDVDSTLQSRVRVVVETGQSYLVRVASFGSSPGGTLRLNTVLGPQCGDGVDAPDSVCDDGDPCNGAETCDANLGCQPPAAPLDCDDGDACSFDQCVTGEGCVYTAANLECALQCFPGPRNCASVSAGKLDFNESKPGKEKGKLEWKGFDIGLYNSDVSLDPGVAPSFVACIYDSNNVLVEGLSVLGRDEDLCDGKPCWKEKEGKGWDYKDKLATADGLSKISIRYGGPGKGKVSVKGANKASKGLDALPVGVVDALQGSDQATIQFLYEIGYCSSTVLDTVKKDEGGRYSVERK